jgi:hypothetical protein
MTKKIAILVLLFIASTGLFHTCFAQDQVNEKKDSLFLVTKNDGTSYQCQILSDDGREILIFTEALGKIFIKKSAIRSIARVNPARDMRQGVYIGEGVFTSRYQFSTNAFPIKRGENYAVINLYGPEVHFSIAKNLSIGSMNTWLGSPGALSIKYTIETKSPKLNFGAGALLATSGFLNQARGFGGLYYGVLTLGTRRNNISLSGGYVHFNWNHFTKTYSPAGIYNLVNLPEKYNMGWRNTIQGPIFGAAGTLAINNRASIILDMFLLTTSNNRYDQNQTYFTINDDNFIQFFEPDITLSEKSSHFVFMPAFRFQKMENRAFQFSLSGVIGKSSSTWMGNTNVRRYSFPVPQLTWYFKF